MTEGRSELSLILVSPNVSEEMGGEAMKALQIYLEAERQGARVHQVTHERVRAELDRKYPGMSVSYVEDTWIQTSAYRFGQLDPLLSVLSESLIALVFQWKAARLVKSLLKTKPGSIVHFTSPISPVLPYFSIAGATVVIGPLNGNIRYPPAFRDREPASDRLRHRLHPSIQRLQRFAFSGKRRASALLVAGDGRTHESLRLAGCRDDQFMRSLDSGVSDDFCERPRIRHSGPKYRFVHIGRLVKFKGTELIVRSLLEAKAPIELDIIGRGPELEPLKHLSKRLGLEDRVKFQDWVGRAAIVRAFQEYRALVLPSLAEANGIVVQEAMALGLPVIALNWGGPASLVTPDTGILIDPKSEQYVLTELARAMDLLAERGELAEQMSIAGRRLAVEEGFQWSTVVRRWMEAYAMLAQKPEARRELVPQTAASQPRGPSLYRLLRRAHNIPIVARLLRGARAR
jgi:alpha-maltose-1-phosphate synthase